MHKFHAATYLDNLPLRCLDDTGESGLWLSSIPMPRGASGDFTLDGRETWVHPLGQWHGESGHAPRRLLMAADGQNESPRSLHLMRASIRQSATPSTPPTAEAERFDACREAGFMWERHMLRLRWGTQSVGLAMGLRHGGEVHWWECCRLVELEATPACRVIEMGGAIPHTLNGMAELTNAPQSFEHPFLHRHNWLYGRLYARLHANGVCEIFAHHINSKFFDDGLALDDVAPVIGIHTKQADNTHQPSPGEWDGSQNTLTVDGVRFDVSEAARLATPDQPGRLDHEGDFLVWQPYMGAELFAGHATEQRTGDPYICRAEDGAFPRGMARTLRFSLSLSDRSPRVARYVPPAWWFGLCEELMPDALLPIVGPYDKTLDEARAWIRQHIHRGGFEDGALPRHGTPESQPRPARHESGWEGEIPHAQFIMAWLTGDATDYHDALRSAYHFTDVAIDHAAKAARMHSYPPHAFSVPMNRVQGMLAAYLETGDPYLLDTARAVLETAHSTNKNAWPRMAIGRDACYGRGAAMFYRYFNEEQFRRMAHEVATMVVQSQRPNGTFGDQAGGTGIHQWGAYITKPWMGLLALGVVLDYLELFPEEPAMLAAVRKFANWLLTSRVDEGGHKTWRYQHDFNGSNRHFEISEGRWVKLPSETRWHQETLARLLGYCAIRLGEPAYLDAWAESHEQAAPPAADHPVAAAMQFLPWLQAKLWNARPSQGGVRASLFDFGPRTPRQATALSPHGPVPLSADAPRAAASPASHVDLSNADTIAPQDARHAPS